MNNNYRTMKELMSESEGCYGSFELGKGTDKDTTHTYADTYQKIFMDHMPRVEPIRILEVGIYGGFSLLVWRDWLKSREIDYQIYGLDIDLSRFCANTGFDLNVSAFVCDSRSEKDFSRMNLGKFSLIIDDGSHLLEDQLSTKNNLFQYLIEGGVYVVEDVMTNEVGAFGADINVLMNEGNTYDNNLAIFFNNKKEGETNDQ